MNLLTVKPANLTQINKRNNGTFPFWTVYRVIDGREDMKGHGDRDMPFGGRSLVPNQGVVLPPRAKCEAVSSSSCII